MGTTADKLNKVLQTKEAIRTAINNKGGTLTTSDKFSDYATAIDNIQSGGGGGDNPLQYVIDNQGGDGIPSGSYLFDNYQGTNLADILSKCNFSKITKANSMFSNCFNLTTISPIDISSCIEAEYMFNKCQELITIPQLDTSSCRQMRCMFQDCSKLITIDLTHMKITSPYYSEYFASGCSSLTKLIIRNMDTIPALNLYAFSSCYHFSGTINNTYNPDGLKDGRIYVPDDKVEELKVATNWTRFADIITPLSLLGKPYISNLNSKSNTYIVNKSSLFFIILFDFINTPEVIITSSNEQVATISDIVITTKRITFKANYLSIGVTTITAQITGDISATKTIDINVIEGMQCRVEQISEATYGFTLNSNEYYESTNKGIDSSYSLCKLVFNTTETNNILELECINSGESSYDFGILSKIDTPLTLSANEDTTNVYKSFKGKSSTIPVVITYPEATVGEHFIYIKYIKDSSGDNGNDSLQFKVIS